MILFVGLLGLAIFLRSLLKLLGLDFLARWVDTIWDAISSIVGGRR